jgi:benzoyl-CoA 2,3-dioxygenase component A
VQDLLRERGADVARLLKDENTYVYLCGLKGMEKGVEEAFTALCQANGLDWRQRCARRMLQQGRYHVETY